jgi:hypothetical protein
VSALLGGTARPISVSGRATRPRWLLERSPDMSLQQSELPRHGITGVIIGIEAQTRRLSRHKTNTIVKDVGEHERREVNTYRAAKHFEIVHASVVATSAKRNS